MCPFIFKNAQLDTLFMGGLVDNFLVRNLWTFDQDINFSPASESGIMTSSMNSSIRSLSVLCYNYRLDSAFLSPLVFEMTSTVAFTGSVSSIQMDVFKSLQSIQLVTMTMDSLGNFVHKIGVDWTVSLPPGTGVILSDSEIYGWSVDYTYPGRDFCIFSAFPFYKSIGAILDLPLYECTQTIEWLIQNYKKLDVIAYPNNTQLIYEICQKKLSNRCSIRLFSRRRSIFVVLTMENKIMHITLSIMMLVLPINL